MLLIFFMARRPYAIHSLKAVKPFYILGLLVVLPLMFSLTPFRLSHAGSLTTSNKKSDIKKDQIRQIETDLSREREQFLIFGTKEKNLLRQLTDIEKEITKKRELLKELKGKIDHNKKELKRQQGRLRRLESSLNEMKERLGQRLIAFYKHAKRGYVQLLATSKDLGQLRKRMKYLHIIMREDQQLLKEMVDVQLRIKRGISRKRERLAIIDTLKSTEVRRMQSLRERLDKKVILLMKIHKEREFYETAVKELQSAAQNLRETLLNLERIEEKRRLQLSGFKDSKGELPLPFDGEIIKSNHPPGYKNLNIHRGIYIKGPLGAGVKAIFLGRVDFSGWLKGYGQTIVINHGSRFFTISACLSQRNKEVGDMVERGEVIGLLGQADTFSGPSLYFEMRRAGINLDPRKWLKVD